MKRYELWEELLPEEAELLEEPEAEISQEASDAEIERRAGQKRMTLARIRHSRQAGRRWRLPVWIAAAILVMGTLVSAAENDWDLRLAQYLGVTEAVEYLDGGYIRLETRDTCDGITVSAVQSIGDKNSQWVQIDTSLPWEYEGEEGYYMFDEYRFQVLDGRGTPVSGGAYFYSFENEGSVSFLLYAQGYEELNRRRIDIELGTLCAYEPQAGNEEKKVVISEGNWRLSWENAYPANVKTAYPFSMVEQQFDDGTEVNCLIYKVEISPISIYVKGLMNPFRKGDKNRYAHLVMEVDSVTLKDGTVIPLGGYNVAGSGSGGFVDCFLSLQEYGVLEVDQVSAITLGGKEIRIR